MIRIEVSHRKSSTVKPEDIVRDDDDPIAYRWFVKSSSSSVCHTVSLINSSCPEPLCRHRCVPCAICIHHFQCSCPDKTHGCSIRIDENDTNANEENIVQETVQFLPVDNNENKRSKRRIQALLENMLSSISVQDYTEEQYRLLEKKQRSCRTIINGDKKRAARKKFKI